jgi:cell division protein FtsZ
VVGTVIDPSLTDELRVTIVLTGLGQVGGSSSVHFSQKAKTEDGSWDYSRLERPTVMRQKITAQPIIENIEKDVEYLDIPAFLRRKNRSTQEQD